MNSQDFWAWMGLLILPATFWILIRWYNKRHDAWVYRTYWNKSLHCWNENPRYTND